MGHLTGLLEKIQPAIEKTGKKDCNDPGFAEEVALTNVDHSIQEILKRSQIINSLYQNGKIGIIGGVYSVETGTVDFSTELFKNKTSQHITQLETA